MKRHGVLLVLSNLLIIFLFGCAIDVSSFLSSPVKISSNEEFDVFEDVTKWTPIFGEVAEDNEFFRSGTQSIMQSRIEPGVVDAKRKININFGSAPRLRINIYFHDTPATLAIIFSSQNDFKSHFITRIGYPKQALKLGWNIVDIYPEQWEMNAGEDWTKTMKGMRIRIEPQEGEIAPHVSWDKMVVNPDGVPGVMLTFDDCLVSTYLKAFNYMKTKEARGTAYIITDRIGRQPTCLTVDQLIEMDSYGWSIANHSRLHNKPLTEYSLFEIESQLRDAKNALDDWGLTKASAHVAYPWGRWDLNVLQAMRSTGMLTGRVTEHLYHVVWTPEGRDYFIGTRMVGAEHTVEDVKSWIDEALSNQRIIGLCFHDLVDTNKGKMQWLTEDFIEIVDYISEKNLPFITINDYHALAMTNTLPINDVYVTQIDEELVVSAPGVTENDYFLEEPPISVELVKLVDGGTGTLIFNDDGSFTYKPPSGWIGEASFQYRICVDKNCTESVYVFINVIE